MDYAIFPLLLVNENFIPRVGKTMTQTNTHLGYKDAPNKFQVKMQKVIFITWAASIVDHKISSWQSLHMMWSLPVLVKQSCVWEPQLSNITCRIVIGWLDRPSSKAGKQQVVGCQSGFQNSLTLHTCIVQQQNSTHACELKHKQPHIVEFYVSNSITCIVTNHILLFIHFHLHICHKSYIHLTHIHVYTHSYLHTHNSCILTLSQIAKTNKVYSYIVVGACPLQLLTRLLRQ